MSGVDATVTHLAILGSGDSLAPRAFSGKGRFNGTVLAPYVGSRVRPWLTIGANSGDLAEKVSFVGGGTISRPFRSDDELLAAVLADPIGTLAWLSWGFGPDDEVLYYMGNGLCKGFGLIEEALATGDLVDTLTLVDAGWNPQHQVGKEERHEGKIGIFPFGGAKVVRHGKIVGVSTFSAAAQDEDDHIAGNSGLTAFGRMRKLTPHGVDLFSLVDAFQTVS